jgi:hypothetical protein
VAAVLSGGGAELHTACLVLPVLPAAAVREVPRHHWGLRGVVTGRCMRGATGTIRGGIMVLPVQQQKPLCSMQLTMLLAQWVEAESLS